MLCWALLQTIDSPFIKLEMIERARRILPQHLFLQYYLSQFVSDSTVYGDLSRIWQDDIIVENPSFWISSDVAARQLPVCIGLDLAKRRDFTVMSAVNAMGQTVGYVHQRIRCPCHSSTFQAAGFTFDLSHKLIVRKGKDQIVIAKCEGKAKGAYLLRSSKFASLAIA